MFGIQIERRAVLFERPTQIAGFFEIRPQVVQLDRGHRVLVVPVLLMQQLRELLFYRIGLRGLAVFAQCGLQVVQRTLVVRIEPNGLLQVRHGQMRLRLAQIFFAQAGLRHGVARIQRYRFFKCCQGAVFVQQSLARLTEVRPCFRKIGPQRDGLLQMRGSLVDLALVATDLGPQIMGISRVRLMSEQLDGAIELHAGCFHLASLQQDQPEVDARLRKLRVE